MVTQIGATREGESRLKREKSGPAELLLPGALLVTMLTQLLAPFMLVDFRFATFFQ